MKAYLIGAEDGTIERVEGVPAEMHKAGVLRGTTAAQCAARKDGTPKGSPSLLAGIDAKMVIIDTLCAGEG